MVKNNAQKRTPGNARRTTNQNSNRKAPSSGPRRVLTTNASLPTPPRSWGGSTGKGGRGGKGSDLALDATCLSHLTLPRAVAPYTIVTQSEHARTTLPFHIFGTYSRHNTSATAHDEAAWSNAIGMGFIDAGLACNATLNLQQLSLPSGLGRNDTVVGRISAVPACLTVHISNTAPLQTTAGMIYVGRISTPLDIRNTSITPSALAGELLSTSQPRAISASQLALDGVSISAIPSDMDQLSKFMGIWAEPQGYVNTTASNNYSISPNGFGSIYIYNPDAIPLQISITVEWRYRFDPGSAAAGSHTFHTPSSLQTWTDTIRSMVAAGNGVYNLMERTGMIANMDRRVM